MLDTYFWIFEMTRTIRYIMALALIAGLTAIAQSLGAPTWPSLAAAAFATMVVYPLIADIATSLARALRGM
jgi:hypothetical protein